MDPNEKIIQISGAGEQVYALSSEGNVYLGTMHDKGFEWKKLPSMNFENIASVIILKPGDENAQAVISATEGVEIQIPKVMRDDIPAAESQPEAKAENK